MNNERQEFSAKTKATLAKRVGFKCSNPNCKRATSGPSVEKDKSVNIGVAAHIIPASSNGPRAEIAANNERSDVNNGIWLCQACSVLIDRDPTKFSKGITKTLKGEGDFEFCTSVVSRVIPTSVGTNIYNLCTLEIIFHELISEEDSFCLCLWKKAKLIIG